MHAAAVIFLLALPIAAAAADDAVEATPDGPFETGAHFHVVLRDGRSLSGRLGQISESAFVLFLDEGGIEVVTRANVAQPEIVGRAALDQAFATGAHVRVSTDDGRTVSGRLGQLTDETAMVILDEGGLGSIRLASISDVEIGEQRQDEQPPRTDARSVPAPPPATGFSLDAGVGAGTIAKHGIGWTLGVNVRRRSWVATLAVDGQNETGNRYHFPKERTWAVALLAGPAARADGGFLSLVAGPGLAGGTDRGKVVRTKNYGGCDIILGCTDTYTEYYHEPESYLEPALVASASARLMGVTKGVGLTARGLVRPHGLEGSLLLTITLGAP